MISVDKMFERSNMLDQSACFLSLNTVCNHDEVPCLTVVEVLITFHFFVWKGAGAFTS